MKQTVRLLAALLCLAMLGAMLLACTPSAKVEKRIYDYLNKKYKGLEFEILDYSQEEKTNGRYRIHMLCSSNKLEFDIYYSTLLTTDSYSVCYANSIMKTQIDEAIDQNAKEFTNIADIQWLDLFEDGSTGYKFREVGPDVSYNLTDMTSIYRIRLASDDFAGENGINEAVQSLFMTVDVLAAKGIHLKKMTFEFTAEGKDYLLETDTDSVKNADLFALEKEITDADLSEKLGENLYSDKKARTISFFMAQEENTENA